MKTTSLICCALLIGVSASAAASTTDTAAPAAAAPAAQAAPAAPSATALVAAPATAPVAATPPTAPAAGEATTKVAAASSSEAALIELQKFARNHGYRSFKKGDGVVWCKTDASLGTRLEHSTCVTEAALVDLRRTTEQNKQDMLRMMQYCTGMSCAKN